MHNIGQAGVLQVIPPAELEAQLQQQATDKAQAADAQQQTATPELAGYIRTQFEMMRNHRNTAAGWSERLLAGLRAFNGQYDAGQLQDVKRFGGSEVYVRMTAQKCRAASSLLRDVYLGPDRPWGLRAPADPDIPDAIKQKIDLLMQSEQQMVTQYTGQPPSPSDLEARKSSLLEAAKDAATKKATKQAKASEDKLEELLREGNFYHALAEFLVDLPIFPFACIKGPVVRIMSEVEWPEGGGRPSVSQKPRLTWGRVSPFDIWFTPGVSDIENADVIEKLRITRAEINELLDLPGYNHNEVRAVLEEYGRAGLYDNWDTTDAERATLESRENPMWNRSGLISMMEFNGNVQGRVLQDYGLAVPDELRDYAIQAWVIGRHVIKASLSPSPRQRHPYFITSFEKVPGTPVGNGLTDLLADVQYVTNATMRAMVNNLGIASGPQVVIDDDRLQPEENGEDMYPWKRWHVRNDPVGRNDKNPIEFFQPQANSEQMLAVLRELQNVADDVSAIPKYVGGQAGSGAGRTASGLAMLMGNASKILQTVSANIDRDVFEGCLSQLVDLILLTDTSGLLTGEEDVVVQGVNVAIQRETVRQRQIEFLGATANPLDQKIMGIKGRGTVLRSVSSTIGLDGDNVVPSDEILDKMQDDQKHEPSPIEIAVQQGVEKGVQAGVARISTELTAGALAMRAHMPEGNPTHIGTPGEMPPPPQGGGQPGAPPPGPRSSGTIDKGPGGDAARQAQGMRPKPLSQAPGQQTDLVGQPKGPGALAVQGGD